MSPTIQVAIISAAGSLIAVAITFILNKRAERRDALHLRILNHYKELLSAISDLAVDDIDKDEANKQFARAVNTIALVAPQYVIDALMEYHREIAPFNQNRTLANHDNKLRILVLAIRRNLGLPFKDNPDTFNFHLIGSKSPK